MKFVLLIVAVYYLLAFALVLGAFKPTKKTTKL